MKKSLIAISILSLFVGTTSLSTLAFDNSGIEKGTIYVNTSADREIAPDVAEISFAIKTSDNKSMQKATEENKIYSDKVYTLLKNMIDSENGDYIKTSDFTANPVYSYQNSKKVFQRYEVSNRVIIRTKSIDKIGKIIDDAINAGATNVDNLSFSVSNYESECNNLLNTATKKAKTRAENIADTLSLKIKGVKNISTSCNANNQNAPKLYMAKNMISDVAAESLGTSTTSISNGVIKINANVNANFLVY